jgi:hypothetical protein
VLRQQSFLEDRGIDPCLHLGLGSAPRIAALLLNISLYARLAAGCGSLDLNLARALLLRGFGESNSENAVLEITRNPSHSNFLSSKGRSIRVARADIQGESYEHQPESFRHIIIKLLRR